MPMYEYRCAHCKKVFAELRRMADREEPLVCPDCGGEASVILSSFSQGKGSESSYCMDAGGGCPSGFS